MPTKDEVRKFLKEHTPGKPEIGGLSGNFWVEWGIDICMSIDLYDDNSIIINNSMLGRTPDEASEFVALYSSVVDFARKVQEFLATP